MFLHTLNSLRPTAFIQDKDYPSCYSTLKKRVSHFPVPSRDVTDQTLSGREKTKLFPPRKSLISDIPARDGKTANSFLQCTPLPYCLLVLIKYIFHPGLCPHLSFSSSTTFNSLFHSQITCLPSFKQPHP
jgi:hypothetical protein